MFSNIQSILSHKDNDSKRNLDDKIIEDTQSFRERRYDPFEKTIIEVYISTLICSYSVNIFIFFQDYKN